MLSAFDKPIPFFGLKLPALISPDATLGGQIKDLHVLAGTIGYWLIGLHGIAGLYHHYIRRDNTLRFTVKGAQHCRYAKGLAESLDKAFFCEAVRALNLHLGTQLDHSINR
jgi:hypothetical protein